MYVLQQLEDGGVGYNMPAVLELTARLTAAGWRRRSGSLWSGMSRSERPLKRA
nr:hypothetical protein P5660_14780 [Bacillus velezensis]